MIKKTLITSWASAIVLLIMAVQLVAPASADFVFDYSRIVSDSNQAASASFDLTGSVVDVASSGFSTDFQLMNVYATAAPSATCGNNVKEVGEACDGTDFGGLSCASYNYNRGTLQCLNSCQQIDSTACYFQSNLFGNTAEQDIWVCGDGELDPNEQCDDGNTLMGDGCDHNCNLESGYQLDESTGGAIEIEEVITEAAEEEVSESETPAESTESTEETAFEIDETPEETVVTEVEPEILIRENEQTFSTSPNYIIKDQRYAIAAEGFEDIGTEGRTQLLYVRYLMLVIFVFIILSAHWIYRNNKKKPGSW